MKQVPIRDHIVKLPTQPRLPRLGFDEPLTPGLRTKENKDRTIEAIGFTADITSGDDYEDY